MRLFFDFEKVTDADKKSKQLLPLANSPNKQGTVSCIGLENDNPGKLYAKQRNHE